MNIVDTPIQGLKVLEPRIFGDSRGFFMETFRDRWFRENVADVSFVQDNHSKSGNGTLRGLHYQERQTQGKLVRVVAGEVYDVAVDIRQGSKSYGCWYGCYLSADNHRQLWIPEGFAHGFLVVSNSAEFVYKCTDYYHPDSEKSIRWDDPSLNIEWPLERVRQMALSEKDKAGHLMSNVVGLNSKVSG